MRSGPTAIEYGLLAAVIAVVIITGVTALAPREDLPQPIPHPPALKVPAPKPVRKADLLQLRNGETLGILTSTVAATAPSTPTASGTVTCQQDGYIWRARAVPGGFLCFAADR